MEIFKLLAEEHHEQAIFCLDREASLRAVIVIHNTTLGPALGGVRMWKYPSTELALTDCLTLARAMTYKAALAGLNLGGGQGIILADPAREKSEALFKSFGRFVDGLGGRFITSVDLGTTIEDLRIVGTSTKYVAGLRSFMEEGKGPAFYAAYGIFEAIKTIAREILGKPSLKKMRVAIQGIGQVGSQLARLLAQEGVELILTDLKRELAKRVAKRLKATFVDPEEIYDLDVDVFSPCAVGGILNTKTIPRLKVKLIAGSANNQLNDEEEDGERLFEKGILYAPDYLINAGGYISVAGEIEGFDSQETLRKITSIPMALLRIFSFSQEERIPSQRVANRMAEDRIYKIGRVKRKFW